MATCAETYTWAAYGTKLKTYLGVSPVAGSPEELDLQAQLNASSNACDAILHNPFTDDDTSTGTDVSHPAEVKQAVFRWVQVYRAKLASTGGLPGSYMSAETGDEKLNFGVTLGSVESFQTYASDVVKSTINHLRLHPWK